MLQPISEVPSAKPATATATAPARNMARFSFRPPSLQRHHFVPAPTLVAATNTANTSASTVRSITTAGAATLTAAVAASPLLATPNSGGRTGSESGRALYSPSALLSLSPFPQLHVQPPNTPSHHQFPIQPVRAAAASTPTHYQPRNPSPAAPFRSTFQITTNATGGSGGVLMSDESFNSPPIRPLLVPVSNRSGAPQLPPSSVTAQQSKHSGADLFSPLSTLITPTNNSLTPAADSAAPSVKLAPYSSTLPPLALSSSIAGAGAFSLHATTTTTVAAVTATAAAADTAAPPLNGAVAIPPAQLPSTPLNVLTPHACVSMLTPTASRAATTTPSAVSNAMAADSSLAVSFWDSPQTPAPFGSFAPPPQQAPHSPPLLLFNPSTSTTAGALFGAASLLPLPPPLPFGTAAVNQAFAFAPSIPVAAASQAPPTRRQLRPPPHPSRASLRASAVGGSASTTSDEEWSGGYSSSSSSSPSDSSSNGDDTPIHRRIPPTVAAAASSSGAPKSGGRRPNPGRESPFQCSVCGKAFTQKGGLVNHSRIHAGERPFSCSRCDRSFTQKCNLTRHERVHTGEKPYACDQCPKRFNRNWGLKTHMKVHAKHGGSGGSSASLSSHASNYSDTDNRASPSAATSVALPPPSQTTATAAGDAATAVLTAPAASLPAFVLPPPPWFTFNSDSKL